MATAAITVPRCTVCNHPERLAIDATLAHGAGNNATADRFGLSQAAVSRHWNSHVSDAWKSAQKMGPYGNRKDLEKMCLKEGISVVEGLKAIYSSYHASFIACREAGDTPKLLAVGREMRAILVEIGKITGELLPHVTTNVTVNQQINNTVWLDIGRDLIAAFADMPDALERIHGVLTRNPLASLPSPEAIESMSRAA